MTPEAHHDLIAFDLFSRDTKYLTSSPVRVLYLHHTSSLSFFSLVHRDMEKFFLVPLSCPLLLVFRRWRNHFSFLSPALRFIILCSSTTHY
jgi:hypothetical protein